MKNTINKKEIQVHAKVWLVYYILTVFWNAKEVSFVEFFDLFLTVILWTTVFYSYHLVLFPKLLDKRKWLTLILISIFFLLLFLTVYTFEENIILLLRNKPFAIPSSRFYRFASFWFANFVLIALGYRYYGESIKQKQQKLLIESNLQKVEIELKNSQLENLKAQFNPHFLFNSLWYIYTLVQGENQKATKAVELLSDMMRYSMQNHEVGELVPLENELNYVNNYIELQKLRNPAMKLDFRVEGDVESIKILPLVLISFVENAFKHGKIDDIEHPLTIYLKVEKNQYIHFKVNNKISLLGKERSSGIGLENVKRRLKSTYDNLHTLKIENDNQYYQTELYIQMK
ncbi:histidine kinase [Arcicella sp. DC2W]|uniref:Histidine kinase n=1 Tax=Arcicella gelida TaxID=2984195 RepID=A0ABU5SAN1_9BACT|nr:histidine kinase [Arcicella sp. DC2W]MEA5405547.1 histidine kinase [Arcicella sp. DC2W]